MSATPTPTSEPSSTLLRSFLGFYLLGVLVLSVWMLASIFPATLPLQPTAKGTESSSDTATAVPQARQLSFKAWKAGDRVLLPQLDPDQGLIALALLAGTLGSFMHAAQSFAAFVGNRELKTSWAWWYVLRPPIGSVLGLLLYFVARAGLLGGASDAVSPYGVVAIGGLGGWFSKQATNKLAEVFDTLFKTAKPPDQKDTLSESPDAPTVSEVIPAPIEIPADPALSPPVIIKGAGFLRSAEVTLDGERLPVTWKSPNELATTIPRAKLSAPGSIRLMVANPAPEPSTSKPFAIQVVDAQAPPLK